MAKSGTLLHASGRWVYPIVEKEKGTDLSSAIVAKVHGEWSSVAFGAPQDAEERGAARVALPANHSHRSSCCNDADLRPMASPTQLDQTTFGNEGPQVAIVATPFAVW